MEISPAAVISCPCVNAISVCHRPPHRRRIDGCRPHRPGLHRARHHLTREVHRAEPLQRLPDVVGGVRPRDDPHGFDPAVHRPQDDGVRDRQIGMDADIRTVDELAHMDLLGSGEEHQAVRVLAEAGHRMRDPVDPDRPGARGIRPDGDGREAVVEVGARLVPLHRRRVLVCASDRKGLGR